MNLGNLFLTVAGLLPAEYPEADRVPVSPRWQVSGHPPQSQQVSVLSLQEMPRRRNVT